MEYIIIIFLMYIIIYLTSLGVVNNGVTTIVMIMIDRRSGRYVDR